MAERIVCNTLHEWFPSLQSRVSVAQLLVSESSSASHSLYVTIFSEIYASQLRPFLLEARAQRSVLILQNARPARIAAFDELFRMRFVEKVKELANMPRAPSLFHILSAICKQRRSALQHQHQQHKKIEAESGEKTEEQEEEKKNWSCATKSSRPASSTSSGARILLELRLLQSDDGSQELEDEDREDPLGLVQFLAFEQDALESLLRRKLPQSGTRLSLGRMSRLITRFVDQNSQLQRHLCTMHREAEMVPSHSGRSCTSGEEGDVANIMNRVYRTLLHLLSTLETTLEFLSTASLSLAATSPSPSPSPSPSRLSALCRAVPSPAESMVRSHATSRLSCALQRILDSHVTEDVLDSLSQLASVSSLHPRHLQPPYLSFASPCPRSMSSPLPTLPPLQTESADESADADVSEYQRLAKIAQSIIASFESLQRDSTAESLSAFCTLLANLDGSNP
eukprot:ANDGO_00741.mRNA.1 hypothetical protein